MNGESGFLVGKGRIVEADYQPSEISTYRGNPLIEALPPIWSEDEVEERLRYYPPYEDSDRLAPAHLRLHLLQSTLQFFEPLPVHLELEQRFSRMIRTGYLARNPRDPQFVSSLHQQADLLSNPDLGSTFPTLDSHRIHHPRHERGRQDHGCREDPVSLSPGDSPSRLPGAAADHGPGGVVEAGLSV